MCLGTFSRLARSLATIYIFARVRIFGTLVPVKNVMEPRLKKGSPVSMTFFVFLISRILSTSQREHSQKQFLSNSIAISTFGSFPSASTCFFVGEILFRVLAHILSPVADGHSAGEFALCLHIDMDHQALFTTAGSISQLTVLASQSSE